MPCIAKYINMCVKYQEFSLANNLKPVTFTFPVHLSQLPSNMLEEDK